MRLLLGLFALFVLFDMEREKQTLQLGNQFTFMLAQSWLTGLLDVFGPPRPVFDSSLAQGMASSTTGVIGLVGDNDIRLEDLVGGEDPETAPAHPIADIFGKSEDDQAL